MDDPLRRPPEAWALVASGFAWLASAGASGALAFVLAVLPGALQLASGVGVLLLWDDVRTRRYGALGALLGVLLALPMGFLSGGATALLLLVLSAAAFAAAGMLSLRETKRIEGVPEATPALALAAQTAGDDALLAGFDLLLPQTTPEDTRRIVREVAEAEERFAERGWLEKPESFHASPPPFAEAVSQRRRAARIDFEHLACESGYAPHPDEPGRERWLGYKPGETAHAWLLRHEKPGRPWLVCIHGYRMGSPWLDLQVFRAEQLRARLGLNVLLPVLPLHGPRSIGRISGDGFFGADVLDMVHAEAQAMWDLRRWLGWIRAQGPTRIGVYGLSLGGYNAALLAGLDAELDCVVAGIPATDLAALVWEHGQRRLREEEARGLERQRVERVLRVVSPLALPPKIAKERRFVFGGNADQLVPAAHVQALVRHWEVPSPVWYPGAHLTFRAHAGVTRQLAEALRAGGLTS
jgi:dienelactone hydrolase